MADDPLDILLVLDNLSGGGAQVAAVALANGLLARGHRVRVLLFVDKGPLRAALSPGIPVVALGADRARQALWPLARAIGVLRPGVVLSFLTHVNVLAVLAVRIAGTGTAVVVGEHAQPSLARLRSPRSARINRIARLVYRFTAAVVCCSPGVRDAWVRLGIKPAHVHAVYNPLVTEALSDPSERRAEHPWAADPSVPLIVAAGRLSIEKDLPMLLRAFARLRQDREARLLMLGEGTLRPELEALAAALGVADDVALPGFSRDLPAMLRAARVLALSSVNEAFPNVIVEALACGTPVVMTACLMPEDQRVMDGWVHASVPVGDDAAMARALAGALDAPPDPAALRAHVRELTVSASVDRYEAVLRAAQRR